MDVEFADPALDRLEVDPSFSMGLSRALVRAFRMRMQLLRAARDERDLYAQRSWHFEKLKGDRQQQYSIRLNDQFRLIVELVRTDTAKVVRIIEIVDYH